MCWFQLAMADIMQDRMDALPHELHPELSGCITTLTVRNVMEVANFCAAMDTLIDQNA